MICIYFGAGCLTIYTYLCRYPRGVHIVMKETPIDYLELQAFLKRFIRAIVDLMFGDGHQ